MELQDWMNVYVQKMKESGYKLDCFSFKDRGHATVDCDIAIDFYSTDSFEKVNSGLQITLRLRETDFTIEIDPYNKGRNDLFRVKININEDSIIPITDQERLGNKLTGKHAFQTAETHQLRFIRTVKEFYNIDLTLDEYSNMCYYPDAFKLKVVYAINGSLRVVRITLQGKQVFAIFGLKTDAIESCFKTALPELSNPKTMLPVPDKILAAGIDRISFTTLVHEARSKWPELVKQFGQLSDKELFTTAPLNNLERYIVKGLRNNFTPDFEMAIRQTIYSFNA